MWVFDPQPKRIIVYQSDRFMTLQKTDTLTGGDVLPGFSGLLTEIFKDFFQI